MTTISGFPLIMKNVSTVRDSASDGGKIISKMNVRKSINICA